MQASVKVCEEVNRLRIDRVAFAAAMAKRDINCKKLVELSGVSRVTVTAVKNGKSCSERTAEKLATVLGHEIISGYTKERS